MTYPICDIPQKINHGWNFMMTKNQTNPNGRTKIFKGASHESQVEAEDFSKLKAIKEIMAIKSNTDFDPFDKKDTIGTTRKI